MTLYQKYVQFLEDYTHVAYDYFPKEIGYGAKIEKVHVMFFKKGYINLMISELENEYIIDPKYSDGFEYSNYHVRVPKNILKICNGTRAILPKINVSTDVCHIYDSLAFCQDCKKATGHIHGVISYKRKKKIAYKKMCTKCGTQHLSEVLVSSFKIRMIIKEANAPILSLLYFLMKGENYVLNWKDEKLLLNYLN